MTPRRFLFASLLVPCLFAGSRVGWAQDQPGTAISTPDYGVSSAPEQPAGSGPAPLAGPVVGAPTLTPPAAVLDTSTRPKFYTVTAALREEYDDNIYTTKDNRVGSFVTEFQPSFLLDFPMQDSEFSARYTFGLDYYEHRSGSSFDLSHQGLIRYVHNFTDRFSLDIHDQVGYFDEPDLLNSVGTPFRNGSYYSNIATAVFNAQWTPLFGTQTTYSNVAVFYNDQTVAFFQDSDENTVSQDFRFAVQPKVNIVAGGIYDDIDYFDFNRGYDNYTANVGADYQALPSVTIGARIGLTYTVPDQLVSSSVSPYASVDLNWQIGKRSALEFSYVHNVLPTDVGNAVGEEADRFSLRLSYDVTAHITVHVAGVETHSNYNSDLLDPGTGSSFSEDDVALDLGGEYRITPNFSVEGGYLFSDISSELSLRDYVRDQVYLGVRGTY